MRIGNKEILKILMLWPSAHAEAYNVTLTLKYSLSVARGLKRLDTLALTPRPRLIIIYLLIVIYSSM